jgi:hypothetical protein
MNGIRADRRPLFAIPGLHLQSAIGNLKSTIWFGGIAQLVERQLCKLEVRGSNPLASKSISDLANQ